MATKHIVNAAVLQALGQGMLINISRAQNVDEAALLDALEAGGLVGRRWTCSRASLPSTRVLPLWAMC